METLCPQRFQFEREGLEKLVPTACGRIDRIEENAQIETRVVSRVSHFRFAVDQASMDSSENLLRQFF